MAAQKPVVFSSASPVSYVAAPTSMTYSPMTYAQPATTYVSSPSATGAMTSLATPYARTVQVAAKESPWGGGCLWQSDKTAFKTWCKAAMDKPEGPERKEMYGYLSECFLDADGDRDGLISHDEFDFLIENAACLPRRFGLAPSWVECYGDIAHRQQARNQMFMQMDKHQRGKIGMEEWVAFTIQHIGEKVKQIDWQAVDFAHLEKTTADEFIAYLATALADRHSEQFKSLYEFLFKCFIESDADEKGTITIDQFDALVEDVAQAPRALGLAPPTAQTYRSDAHRREARQALFNDIDTDQTGIVTFDKFLNWALRHIAMKVQTAMASKYKKDGDKTAPWGGGCPWQYDKTAFKSWLALAIDKPTGAERKELYGYLSECFLDADGDRDGLISHEEFDFLIERAATLPRRFGLAPSWIECYGDVAHRQEARNQMFVQMDKHQRQKIGMEEWVAFAIQHITEKVKGINWSTLDFVHLEQATPASFVKFLEIALNDKHSEHYKSLYEFLFKTFVESDVDEKGAVTIEQFDILIEDAAQAPRKMGLAPPSDQAYPTPQHKRQARQAEFDAMDSDRTGTITFDEFLNWCLTHINGKIQQYRAGGGR